MTEAQDGGGATPKIKRGSWHQWAREMREQGYTYAQIAEAIGVSSPAVYFCINPHKRAKPKKKREDEASPRDVSVDRIAD